MTSPAPGGTTPDAAARWSVVVPTVGRPSLDALLASLDRQPFSADVPAPEHVVVVDDRRLPPTGATPTPLHPASVGGLTPLVVRTGGRGPAAARNAGWRSVRSGWVVFLDDDVLLPDGWAQALVADLREAADDVAGVQARLRVPLPTDRPPTDWERSTAGLERARWATADMAYRRMVLDALGGFDERFPRAYREDADLALRVRRAGWRLTVGGRTTTHPVRPADDAVSLRVQAGAADDALLRALYGRRWRTTTEAGRGRFGWHVATVAAGTVGLAGAATWTAATTAALVGHRRAGAAGSRPAGGARAGARLAALGAGAWTGLTLDFTARRVLPGPRPGTPGWREEWRRMAWTSGLIPLAAVLHRLRGTLTHAARRPAPWPVPVRAVLFDRDGTLVRDVPYNGDPARVEPVPGAREVLDALRAAGVAVGIVSNQSGVARGLLTADEVDAVNARVAELLGPFGTVRVCPHGPEEGCPCRKPGPGLVLDAARDLGVAPWECAVVGDIGADLGAAVAAGARAVLVPTPATRPEEITDALTGALVACDLATAVAFVVPQVTLPGALDDPEGHGEAPPVAPHAVGALAGGVEHGSRAELLDHVPGPRPRFRRVGSLSPALPAAPAPRGSWRQADGGAA